MKHGGSGYQRGLESRVGWRLNVWIREVAAGRNLNDGSFILYMNLIVMGAACSAHMKKVKKFPVHAMKAYGGSRDTAPLIHNFGIRWRRVVNLTIQMLYPGIQ
jgi:hypothetical protein